MSDRICSIPECGRPVTCKGWCQRHYIRAWRHGDPLGGPTFHGEPLEYFMAHRYEWPDECKIWPYGLSYRGYGIVRVAGIRTKFVHVIACTDRWGPAPKPEMQAAHGPCHNPSCWNGEHLSWKTPTENQADKHRDGTHIEGERHPGAKLTTADVLEIRAAAASGATQLRLAAQYGVSKSLIWAILKRKKWTHV
jgi:hypothetical protein